MAISLIDALAQTEDKTKGFQMKWISFNKSKKQGGDIMELTNATRAGAKFNLYDNDMIAIKQKGNSNHNYPVHIHLIVEFNHQPIFI
jgi:hypothetical protein